MAIDGTYNMVVRAGAGDQPGTITFKTDGEALTGSLTAEEGTTEFEGTATEDSFTFEADIDSPIGKLPAKVVGKVVDGKLSGSFKTPMGDVAFTGSKA